MNAIDFEYDSHFLSDYGFIICDFDHSSDVSIASAGSVVSFNKVPMNHGKTFSLVGTDYEECITATFDICKNPCGLEDDEMVITNDEYRDLMRWLNRREFARFRIIADNNDDDDIDTCYFDASFNVEKIKHPDNWLIGLRLTLETNRPYGYGEQRTEVLEFASASVTKRVYDYSDDVGYIYPDMEITAGEGGTLEITNSLMNCTMVIYGCTAGEKITIHGNEQIITTSLSAHDICSDFNYNFMKFGNTFSDNCNVFSVTKACTIKLTYSPIIKDTP